MGVFTNVDICCFFFIKAISLFVQTKYLLKNQTSQFDLLHLRNEE